jgi:enoyl-CoA hydratase
MGTQGEFKHILYEEKPRLKEYKSVIYQPGKVTRIIMNRPDKRNALSHPLYKELEDAFDRAATDPECRVIVHSGAGKCFCAGHDVDVASSLEGNLSRNSIPYELEKRAGSVIGRTKAAEQARWEEHTYYAAELKLRKWRTIPKPTIAMVHSYAIFGGFFSAAAMDIIFASEDALFLPALGEYDVSGWDFNPRKAKELLFEHRFMPAREAYECGFVSRIFPDYETLEKETLAFANRVADNPFPDYITAIKRSINHTMDIQGFTTSLEAADNERLLWTATQSEEEFEARTESKGNARVPRALANLKAKQDAERKSHGK